MQLSTSVTAPDARVMYTEAASSRAIFEEKFLEIIPSLRAFALSLTRDHALSDDLVQETAVRALRGYRGFQIGTNMTSWAFTILKNLRLNEFRRAGSNNVELTEIMVARAAVGGNQEDTLELKQTVAALNGLKPAHREVLTLVRALGHNYAQAAKIMLCPLGTIKSRLNRADAALRAVVDRPVFIAS